MFLTEEENQQLTGVGPGTPGGELLRRYWQPIGGLHLVSEETPTAFVRALGEDLVLFRDKSGNVGLLADHCSHRGASLLYGRVEERGLACAYHGWLYDTTGNCLETPAEPADSKFHLTVKHRAYPVEKYMGLFWTYMGPLPAPPLRKLDVGTYPVAHVVELIYDANWVQIVENHVDSTHIYILHQDTANDRGTLANTTRGRIDHLAQLDYEEFEFGIRRNIVPDAAFVEDDRLVFPNMLRRVNQVQIHSPIDDHHTRTFKLYYLTERDGYDGDCDREPVNYYVIQRPGEGKLSDGAYPDARYRIDTLTGQDVMAIETQGPYAPRHNWRLGTSDRGVMMYERLLQREMQRVQQGLEPFAVVKDPNVIIDTNYEAYVQKAGRSFLTHEGLQVYARPSTNGHRAASEPARESALA